MRGIINDDVESFRGGLFAHVRKELDVLLVALEQRDAISQIPVRWDLQIDTDNAGTGEIIPPELERSPFVYSELEQCEFFVNPGAENGVVAIQVGVPYLIGIIIAEIDLFASHFNRTPTSW